MERRQTHALPALTGRISCAVLVLWLLCMYALTAVTAESLYLDDWTLGQTFSENAWKMARLDERLAAEQAALPGYTEHVLWMATESGAMSSNYGRLSDTEETNHFPILQTDRIANENGIAVFDAAGNPVAYPANFFTLAYSFDEADALAGTAPDGYAVCVLDWQMEPEQAAFKLEQSFLSSIRWDALCYRITGVLEDGYLTVTGAEYLLDPKYLDPEAQEQTVWREMPFGTNGTVLDGTQTVTLYTNYVYAQTYTPGRSFRHGGEQYDHLQDFMLRVGPETETWDATQAAFTDFVYAQKLYYHDWSHWDGTAENMPETEYEFVVAMLASPWRSAMAALTRVYSITFLIAVLGVLWLSKTLKRRLVQPVAAVNRAAADGWSNIDSPGDRPKQYAEIGELFTHYGETKSQRYSDRDTIARLERAVHYAEEAEANRRQMTSNIAHELKTPLAVIHSYAEGLSERIAEEKRERYLDVIRSETERMDGMVLEMLDLSRLEAGKVVLHREEFSLSTLAASVFERLERAIAAKELKLTLEPAADCVVNADPFRMEQVITNFAVNAVKYTPAGGSIAVRTVSDRRGVTLTVENDSPPLSGEALSKVWEPFYSAETSRAGSGTGLGLAISKSIVALHGGNCFVRNTKTGVVFGFSM